MHPGAWIGRLGAVRMLSAPRRAEGSRRVAAASVLLLSRSRRAGDALADYRSVRSERLLAADARARFRDKGSRSGRPLIALRNRLWHDRDLRDLRLGDGENLEAVAVALDDLADSGQPRELF